MFVEIDRYLPYEVDRQSCLSRFKIRLSSVNEELSSFAPSLCKTLFVPCGKEGPFSVPGLYLNYGTVQHSS